MANYNLSLPAETIDELLTWLDDKQGIIIKQTDLLSGTGQSTTATMTQKAITDALGTKADASSVYTKTQTDTLLNAKANKSTTYTKGETNTLLNDKVDKEAGKGLSSNDYTDGEKTKLGALPTAAELSVNLAAKQDKDTDAVAGNVAVMDGNGNSVDGGVALADLATKAEVEAVEQEVAQIAGEAGLAEAVIDTDGAGTEQQFTFRKSGGDGGAYYRKIKGKTIVEDNQLASNDAESIETVGVNLFDADSYFNNPNVSKTTNGWQMSTSSFYSLGNLLDNSKLGYGEQIYIRANITLSPPSNSTPYIAVKYTDGSVENVLDLYGETGIKEGVTNANKMVKRIYANYGAGGSGIFAISDICINFSNPAINGQYFPYWKRTINIGITTRKDTDGNVPFPNGLQSCPVAQDEATKEGGTIRVGTRAYQAGDESDADVITDGTNTNYALATPVPFTWAEPLNLGVKVDENGTERAVAPEGATAPSAPFVADTTYTMSVARMVEILKNL